jgi:uncharacterized protein
MTTLRNFGDWALVTGATSGIGTEYADALAAQGFNLILVARGAEGLAATASAIRAKHRVTIETLAADLSDPAALPSIFGAAARNDVAVVVSNAGAGGLGPFLDTDIATHRSMLQLNAGAHLEIAHHFASRFRTRTRRGAILLASSTAGLHGMPYGAAYAAAKAAVISLAESLNVELAGTGVHITAVSPGMTDTPATRDDPAIDFSRLPFKAVPAVAVAREGLDALARNAPHHIVGGLNRFISNIVEQRITGRALAVKLMGKVVSRALKAKPDAARDEQHSAMKPMNLKEMAT